MDQTLEEMIVIVLDKLSLPFERRVIGVVMQSERIGGFSEDIYFESVVLNDHSYKLNLSSSQQRLED